MDINEITQKRRYGPASVSDVNTRWRSWFEGFNFRRNRTGMCIKTRPSKVFAVWPFFFLLFHGLFSCLKVGPMICSVGTAATSFTGLGMAVMRVIFCPSLTPHRFSAFWLRSKCSICSYQLNIWYEDHVSSSILIWFLPGETRSVACNAGFTSWPCIAVSQGSAHFPINLLQKNWFLKSLWSLWWISSTESKVPKVFAS